MIELISASQYQSMPWKNGFGVTAQIAIEPPAAVFGQDDFLWRLSSAKITASSPFSVFSGYERLLAVYQGDGFEVNNQALTAQSHPLAFSGDIPLECRLLGGETTDLGLIFKRDKATAEIKRAFLTDEKLLHEQIFSAGTHLLFCLSGSFSAGELTAQSGDTVKITAPEKIKFTKLTKEKVEYFHITINIRP